MSELATPAAADVRILIATPVYGSAKSASVAVAYHMAVTSLVRDSHFGILPAVYGCDVIRARSRVVRQFLEETSATHLLWWDADTAVDAAQAGRLVARLVDSGEAFVGCTYPKKRVHWGRGPGEESAYDYPISLAKDGAVDEHACCSVEGLPLGFALCTRSMLQAMARHYGDELGFVDVLEGRSIPTVALFQLARVPDTREGLLLGEDYSFSHRWRAMGGRCALYVGEDCELGHVGSHVFQGHREGYCR